MEVDIPQYVLDLFDEMDSSDLGGPSPYEVRGITAQEVGVVTTGRFFAEYATFMIKHPEVESGLTGDELKGIVYATKQAETYILNTVEQRVQREEAVAELSKQAAAEATAGPKAPPANPYGLQYVDPRFEMETAGLPQALGIALGKWMVNLTPKGHMELMVDLEKMPHPEGFPTLKEIFARYTVNTPLGASPIFTYNEGDLNPISSSTTLWLCKYLGNYGKRLITRYADNASYGDLAFDVVKTLGIASVLYGGYSAGAYTLGAGAVISVLAMMSKEDVSGNELQTALFKCGTSGNEASTIKAVKKEISEILFQKFNDRRNNPSDVSKVLEYLTVTRGRIDEYELLKGTSITTENKLGIIKHLSEIEQIVEKVFARNGSKNATDKLANAFPQTFGGGELKKRCEDAMQIFIDNQYWSGAKKALIHGQAQAKLMGDDATQCLQRIVESKYTSGNDLVQNAASIAKGEDWYSKWVPGVAAGVSGLFISWKFHTSMNLKNNIQVSLLRQYCRYLAPDVECNHLPKTNFAVTKMIKTVKEVIDSFGKKDNIYLTVDVVLQGVEPKGEVNDVIDRLAKRISDAARVHLNDTAQSEQDQINAYLMFVRDTETPLNDLNRIKTNVWKKVKEKTGSYPVVHTTSPETHPFFADRFDYLQIVVDLGKCKPFYLQEEVDIIETTYNGDCFYDSIAKLVTGVPGVAGLVPIPAGLGDLTTANRVRAQIAQAFRNWPTRHDSLEGVEDMLYADATSDGDDANRALKEIYDKNPNIRGFAKQAAQASDDAVKKENIEKMMQEYGKEIKSHRVWANLPEIVTLALTKDVKICVYEIRGGVYKLQHTFGREGDVEARATFHVVNYGNVHFVGMKPKSPTAVGEPRTSPRTSSSRPSVSPGRPTRKKSRTRSTGRPYVAGTLLGDASTSTVDEIVNRFMASRVSVLESVDEE